jgi:hypothetical protein
MGTSSVALLWYLLCLGGLLFVGVVAGVLIVLGRRSEERARARLRARAQTAQAKAGAEATSGPSPGATPADPEPDPDEPPA